MKNETEHQEIAPGPGQQPERQYETKSQLATRICTSTRTINNLMDEGLPYLRLSRKLVRYPVAAVNEWLRNRLISR